MPAANVNQQAIFRRMWSNSSKRLYNEKLGPGMKIIGRVVGQVNFKDISRVVQYNQVIHLTEIEINRSRELQHAIRMKWVEVIEDKGMLRRANAIQTPQPQPKNENEMDSEKMMQLAKEMAKTMAQEMIANSNDTVKELTSEIAALKEKLGESFVPSSIVPEQQKQAADRFVVEEDMSNVVIDVEETSKANISSVGEVKEEKSDIGGSLAKMRKFRRKANG